MTYDTDITGYGRKMGRNAGMTADGKLEGVHRMDGTWVPEGTISARTMTPSNTESQGGIGNIGDYWTKPRWISQDTTYPGESEKGTLVNKHPGYKDSNYPY